MERQWYYVVGGKEKAGPISETELRQRIQTGQVQPADLVWSEGMGNWQPAGQALGSAGAATPMAASPVAAYGGTAAASYGAAAVPEGLLGWTKFVGVMIIISGVFTCLSCIGIPIGIMMIVAGNALLGSRRVLEQHGGSASALEPYLQHMKKFMLMMGIICIIYLVIFVLYIIFIAVMISGGMMNMGDLLNQ